MATVASWRWEASGNRAYEISVASPDGVNQTGRWPCWSEPLRNGSGRAKRGGFPTHHGQAVVISVQTSTAPHQMGAVNSLKRGAENLPRLPRLLDRADLLHSVGTASGGSLTPWRLAIRRFRWFLHWCQWCDHGKRWRSALEWRGVASRVERVGLAHASMAGATFSISSPRVW